MVTAEISGVLLLSEGVQSTAEKLKCLTDRKQLYTIVPPQTAEGHRCAAAKAPSIPTLHPHLGKSFLRAGSSGVQLRLKTVFIVFVAYALRLGGPY